MPKKKFPNMENKAVKARETKATQQEKVRVRIKPFRAVHGYGGPGWEGEMPEELARKLAADGYVEILDKTQVGGE